MCNTTTCPEARRCIPRLPPDTDPRTVVVCCCDPDADRLAALIGEGIDQHTASLMLWAPDQLEHRAAS